MFKIVVTLTSIYVCGAVSIHETNRTDGHWTVRSSSNARLAFDSVDLEERFILEM